MIFFVGNEGMIINSTPSPVYQGSANANDIFLVAPFAKNLTVTVSFTLPNGVIKEPRAMASIGFIEGVINGETQEQYAMWQFSLPNEMTRYYGTVNMQFTFYGTNGQTLASSGTSFVVGKGVPVVPPTVPDETVYEDILKNLSQLQQEIANGYAGFADTMQVETNTLFPNEKASVTVTPVQGTPNTAKQFKFVFNIPQGKTGESGEDGEDGEDGNPVYYLAVDMEEVGYETEHSLRLFTPQYPSPKIGSICISSDGFLCQVLGIEDGNYDVKALHDLNGQDFIGKNYLPIVSPYNPQTSIKYNEDGSIQIQTEGGLPGEPVSTIFKIGVDGSITLMSGKDGGSNPEYARIAFTQGNNYDAHCLIESGSVDGDTTSIDISGVGMKINSHYNDGETMNLDLSPAGLNVIAFDTNEAPQTTFKINNEGAFVNGNKIGTPAPSGLLYLDVDDILTPTSGALDIEGKKSFLPPISKEQAEAIGANPIYALTNNMQLVRCEQQSEDDGNATAYTNVWNCYLVRNMNLVGNINGATTVNGNLHIAAGNKLYADTISGEPKSKGGTGEVTISSNLNCMSNVDLNDRSIRNVGDLQVLQSASIGSLLEVGNILMNRSGGYGYIRGLKALTEFSGTQEGNKNGDPNQHYRYDNVLKIDGNIFFTSRNDIESGSTTFPNSAGIYFTDGDARIVAAGDDVAVSTNLKVKGVVYPNSQI